MPKFSFIFHKNVYLRHVVDAPTFQEAEKIALEASDAIGTTFETPFLLEYSRRIDPSASEGILEIPQA